MLQLTQKGPAADTISGTLTLTFDQRARSRLRAALDDGRVAAVILDRGAQLLPGDILLAESGEIVQVQAALESLSIVRSEDTLLLARACYHLGNRHVALQVEVNELRYQHDHVLDEMIRLLGLEVEVRPAPFEPESGAYGAHAHIHGHDH